MRMGLSARVVLCRARVFVCCPCAPVSAHSLYELSHFVIIRQLIEFAIKNKKIAFHLTFKSISDSLYIFSLLIILVNQI